MNLRVRPACARAVIWSVVLACVLGVTVSCGGKKPPRQRPAPEVERPVDTEAAAVLAAARAQMARGDLEGAATSLEELLAAFPRSAEAADARVVLARAYMDLGRTDDAHALLEGLARGRELTPEGARVATEVALRRGDIPAAVHHYLVYRRAYAFAPEREDMDARMLAALEQLPADELGDVVGDLRGTDLYGAAVLVYAEMLVREGDAQRARDVVASLLKKYPEDPAHARAETMYARIERLGDADPYTIGVLLPLSGPLGEAGMQVLTGMTLATGVYEEAPPVGRDGTTPYRLAIEDTRGDPEVARQAVRRLVLEERAVVILGPLATTPALEAALEARRLGVPMISLANNPGVNATGRMVFRTGLSPAEQVAPVMHHLHARTLTRNYAILAPETDVGGAYTAAFRRHLNDGTDTVLVVTAIPQGKVDLREEITTLLPVEEELEAVFIPVSASGIRLIAPQLRYHGVMEKTLIGTRAWNSETLVRELQAEDLEGALFADSFFSQSRRPGVRRFVDAYVRQFGEEPTGLAAEGYQAAKLAVDILRGWTPAPPSDSPRGENITGVWNPETAPVTRTEVLAALRKLARYPALTGPAAMSRDGVLERPAILLTVHERKIVEVE